MGSSSPFLPLKLYYRLDTTDFTCDDFLKMKTTSTCINNDETNKPAFQATQGKLFVQGASLENAEVGSQRGLFISTLSLNPLDDADTAFVVDNGNSILKIMYVDSHNDISGQIWINRQGEKQKLVEIGEDSDIKLWVEAPGIRTYTKFELVSGIFDKQYRENLSIDIDYKEKSVKAAYYQRTITINLKDTTVIPVIPTIQDGAKDSTDIIKSIEINSTNKPINLNYNVEDAKFLTQSMKQAFDDATPEFLPIIECLQCSLLDADDKVQGIVQSSMGFSSLLGESTLEVDPILSELVLMYYDQFGNRGQLRMVANQQQYVKV